VKLEEFINECYKLAGIKDKEKYASRNLDNVGFHLENLADPIKSRNLIIEYAMPSIRYEIRRIKSPWRDDFGDTNMIDVPVLITNGGIGFIIYWKYRDIMKYALENLNPDEKEENVIKKGLAKIAMWEKTCESMIEF